MHTGTWLAWLAAAVLVAGLTNNPLYLLLVLLATTLVFRVWREPTPLARTYRLFVIAGFGLWLGYMFFGVVTVGGARGQTIVLTLPEMQLPPLLGGVTLGGPVAAEDLAWGAARGLQIWTLMAVFGVFNALVDHYRLLRMTPRSLFHVGLVVTIAISFVPQLVRSITEITEAQRVRGHRFRGPGSYMPLVGPLLAGSLESSIQLAEALDARGYGRTQIADPTLGLRQFGIVVGLVGFGTGLFLWLYYGISVFAVALLVGCGALLVLMLRSLGHLVQRTTYRQERWRLRDTCVVLGAAGTAAVWIGMRLLNTGDMVYNPYAASIMPHVSMLAPPTLLVLAIPALLRPRKHEGRIPRPPVRRKAPGQTPPAVAKEEVTLLGQ